MIIDGISYEDQGEYVNLIAGRRNKVQNEPVKMKVRGKNKKYYVEIILILSKSKLFTSIIKSSLFQIMSYYRKIKEKAKK